MLDISKLYSLRENNQLEVKTAKGGIPSSIWETYSAFANTYGGTILLGVSENSNKELIPIKLTELEANALVKSFWDTIHSDKVSINLLTDRHIKIEIIEDSYIVVIDVPQASRFDKPVYLNNNLYLCYRRNHEGDYKCSKREVVNMVRDNDTNSQDSYIVENLTIDVLCKETIEKYRSLFINHRGNSHPFSNEPIDLFLRHIGAAKFDDKNILRLTKAGLLMFGYNYDIVTIFPNFFLDYQDKRNVVGDMRWINRVYSSTGDWSGNLLDFFLRIINFLNESIKVPYKMDGIYRNDITPMHKVIEEVLCNCLSNADYNETRGLVIKQYNDRIEFSNPGAFTMHKELAFAGGNSDARNKSILTMFNNINAGERTGSGIPLILNTTKDEGYSTPTFQDFFNPDYTLVTIYLQKAEIHVEKAEVDDEKTEVRIKKGENTNDKPEIDKLIHDLSIRNDVKERLMKIYNLLGNQIISNSIISDALQLGHNASDTCIKVLLANNLIEPIKGQGKGKYKFK